MAEMSTRVAAERRTSHLPHPRYRALPHLPVPRQTLHWRLERPTRTAPLDAGRFSLSVAEFGLLPVWRERMKVCPNCGTRYDDSHRFCFLDGAALVSESPHAELIGTVIAERYHIISKLGEGGMGEVYLAEHVRIKRKSAVKIMRPGMMSDPVAVSRFNREAENASQIAHPNVAAVYDFGETANGLIFLAMEYIDGESLHATLLREKALHAVRAADIIRQAADALSAAHGHGILHRDLKPDKIMLSKTRSGTDVVKIVDFGIARVMSSRTQAVTSTGLIVGTPDYMSREQLAGDQLDARSDIYALALIAFHILTGAYAFPSATSKETLLARLTQLPRRLKEVKDDINWPEALQSTFDRALAPDPTDRYEDALDFANELELAIYMMPATQTAELYRKALEVRRSTPRSITPSTVPAIGVHTETPSAPRDSMYDTRLDRETSSGSGSTAVIGEPRSSGGRRRALAIGAVAVVAIGVFALYKQMSKSAFGPPGAAADTTSAAAVISPAIDTAPRIESASATVPDSAAPSVALSEDELVRRARRAIVTVIATNGEGTGFLVDSSGLVVTTLSRLTSGQEPAVQIGEQTRVRARVVVTDPATDVAILAIHRSRCLSGRCVALPLASGDSASRPALSDTVIAIGATGRRMRGTVTSAPGAPLTTSVRVSGSSLGAPLLGRDGRVLALATTRDGRRAATCVSTNAAILPVARARSSMS